MSAWGDLWRVLTTPPQQRMTEIRAGQAAGHAAGVQAGLARHLAKGRARQCGVCGAITTQLQAPGCPTCLFRWDGVAPLNTQAFRTYVATPTTDVDTAFQAEAALMARAGWRVTSQAYGGQSGAGLAVAAFGTWGGLAASRKPTQMTVIYERTPTPYAPTGTASPS